MPHSAARLAVQYLSARALWAFAREIIWIAARKFPRNGLQVAVFSSPLSVPA